MSFACPCWYSINVIGEIYAHETMEGLWLNKIEIF